MRDKSNKNFFLLTILFALLVILSASPSALEIQELKPGEAEVWYLGHCGYAVKTQNHLLIFDYIELEENPSERGLDKGFVAPLEIRDLNVSVFVTHSHVDHYDEIIHSWQNEIKNIRYIFGWEVNEEQKILHHYLEGPREELRLDDMEIYTVNSFHSFVPEVAYLVKVDGLVIYHGGDYQGKMGRNAPSNAKEDMRYLETKADAVDLFFIGAWTGPPYMQSIESLQPKVIFPMHERKKEENYKRFAAELKNLGIAIPVVCPEKRGDRFSFRNGIVQRPQTASR
ncbi:MAG: MBL fold metallo-hydrolase [Candidatus Aminicenantes bacterium]|nr:MAG: MBL fold metallo-hydrolase [Candidatus Aminicenantes bacterium]